MLISPWIWKKEMGVEELDKPGYRAPEYSGQISEAKREVKGVTNSWGGKR